MAIKEAIEKLKAGIKDLSELEVQTYSGTVEATIDQDSKENIIDWEKLFASAKPGGSVVLAAATKIQADGDTYNFISSQNLPPAVMEAHQAALEAGNQVRENIIDLFADLLGLDD